jgi:hypothetical protein
MVNVNGKTHKDLQHKISKIRNKIDSNIKVTEYLDRLKRKTPQRGNQGEEGEEGKRNIEE